VLLALTIFYPLKPLSTHFLSLATAFSPLVPPSFPSAHTNSLPQSITPLFPLSFKSLRRRDGIVNSKRGSGSSPALGDLESGFSNSLSFLSKDGANPLATAQKFISSLKAPSKIMNEALVKNDLVYVKGSVKMKSISDVAVLNAISSKRRSSILIDDPFAATAAALKAGKSSLMLSQSGGVGLGSKNNTPVSTAFIRATAAAAAAAVMKVDLSGGTRGSVK
jgi:hypothetical protein